MADNQAILGVGIDARGAQTGADAFATAMNRIQKSWIGMTAQAAIGAAAFRKAWASMSEGAQFDESMGRLNRQMANFDSNAAVMIRRMKEVTSGQLSNAEAASAASRALAVGMNPAQIEVFAEAAEALSDRLGGSVTQSMNELTDSMVSGRTKLLGNINVWYDGEKAIKDFATANDRTVDSITEQEKAMIRAEAVTTRLKTALAGMSDEQPSNADKMERMSKTFDDMGLAAKRAAATGLMSFLDAMDKIKNSLKAFIPQNEFTTGKWFDKLIGMDAETLAKERAEKRSTEPPDIDKNIPSARLEASVQRQRDALTALTDDLKKQNDVAAQSYALSAELLEGSLYQSQQLKIAFHEENLRLDVEHYQKELAIVRQGYQKQQEIGFETYEQKVSYEDKYASTLQDLLNRERAAQNRYEEGVRIGAQESKLIQMREREELGRRVQDSLISQFNIQEDMRRRDFESAQTYAQGEIDLARFQYASEEELYRLEREKLQQQMAFKLRLKKDEIDRLLLLQQNGGQQDAIDDILMRGDATLTMDQKRGMFNSMSTQDSLLAEQQRGDVFAGWRRGMQQYVQDTRSAFGMAQDMARRTAQMMEQSFQKFFFDAFEGQIKGMKDVLQSLGDFAKTIMSQLAAQLITSGLLRALTGIAGSMGGGSIGGPVGPAGDVGGFALRANGGISAFQDGGIATRPMLRWAGGGLNLIGEGKYNEAYVPLPNGRSIPVDLTTRLASMPQAQQRPGVVVNVVNNAGSDNDIQVQQSTNGNGMDQIDIIVEKKLNKAIRDGKVDKALGSRYNAKVQAVRR